MTDSHQTTIDYNVTVLYPSHDPREKDPNYKYFHQAHDRLKKAGKLVCQVTGDAHHGQIELHHDLIEFSLQNGVDLGKFNELYGLHLDDAGFKKYVEEEGNLEPLCTRHHRGDHGIHQLNAPFWNYLRVAKQPDDIKATKDTEIPVTNG